MKKFEYYSFSGKHGDETNQILDKLGMDGWVAFEIVPDGEEIVIYLKREKQ